MMKLLALLLCFHSALCLHMYISREKPRCISQELDNEDTATFTVSATRGTGDGDLSATIKSPDGAVLKKLDLSISGDAKEFSYNANSRGAHSICFAVSGPGVGSVKATFNIDFRSRTIFGGKISTKVNKDEIPTVEAQLLMAEESIADISTEIEYARRQEIELKTSGETISDRIQWFGILSIFVLLTVSCWQVLYLRHFFTTKKLL